MSYQTAEMCRQVSDIIDYEPERFTSCDWESENENCETTACIAGHVGLLSGDSVSAIEKFCDKTGAVMEDTPEFADWLKRQSGRLGLTFAAGQMLFWNEIYTEMSKPQLSKVLRTLKKHTETTEALIGFREFCDITDEALA